METPTEKLPQPDNRAGCAVAAGSRLFVFDDGTDGLTYIAESPAPEYGGFHPHTVAIAKGAIAELERLRGIIARNAMQRLDDSKFYITPDDIAASIEIAADYRQRHANSVIQ